MKIYLTSGRREKNNALHVHVSTRHSFHFLLYFGEKHFFNPVQFTIFDDQDFFSCGS